MLSHLLVCRNKQFNLVKPAQKERKEQQLPSLQLRKVPLDSRHHFPPKPPTGGLEFSTLDALKELFIYLFILFYISKHGIYSAAANNNSTCSALQTNKSQHNLPTETKKKKKTKKAQQKHFFWRRRSTWAFVNGFTTFWY